MLDDERLERLIRSIDPAQTPLRDELDIHAERELSRITQSSKRSTAAIERRHRRAAWVAVPTFMAAIVVALLAFQAWSLFGAHTATQAVAATPPLLNAKPTSESYGGAMNRAISQLRGAGDSSGEASRRAAYATWNLDTDFDRSGKATSYISPQEVTLSWNPDLSGELKRVAGSPIATDLAALPGQPKPPEPGTVIMAETYGPGQTAISNANQPPISGVEALQYLQVQAGPNNLDPVALLDALGTVLNEWTLTKAQEAAMLDAVRQAEGMTVYGTVTDRLGREGTAFLGRSSADTQYQSLLIVSTATGEILSIEKIYLGGNPAIKIPVPSVVSYTAWKKNQ